MIESGVISIEEAAAALNTTRLNILMLIKRGDLAGELRDGEWQITTSSVEARIGSETVAGPTACAVAGCKCAGSCAGKEGV